MGCSICGPCRPGHRKIGGVGTRLRQLDIREVRIAAAARRSALQDHARVDAKEEHQPENDENAENADPAAAARAAAWKANAAAWEGEAAAFVPPVLDVLALSFAAPAHGSLTSISVQDRPIFEHCACAARWHKVHPWAAELFGARRVEGRTQSAREASRGVKARPQALVAIDEIDKEPSKNCHRRRACCSCPVVFGLGR